MNGLREVARAVELWKTGVHSASDSMIDIAEAIASAPAPGGEHAARYFASGPGASFWTNSGLVAEMIVNRANHPSDWTITDLYTAPRPPSPISGDSGERGDGLPEPVAWLCTPKDGSRSDATCRTDSRDDYLRFGRRIEDLYTADQMHAYAQQCRSARVGEAPTGMLCRECGNPTMHAGPLCFSCGKKAKLAMPSVDQETGSVTGRSP